MPTGYTAYIEDGEITTGKEFLTLCTRAFGVAIDLKDEPLSIPTPRHTEPDSWYENAYKRAQKTLKEAQSMSFEDAKKTLIGNYEDNIQYYTKRVKELTSLKDRYDKIRNEVEQWVPPTDDHKELKKFALAQIDMCNIEEKEINRYKERSRQELDDSDEAVKKYISSCISYCQQEVDNAYKRWQDELKRVSERNEWMDKFIESVE